MSDHKPVSAELGRSSDEAPVSLAVQSRAPARDGKGHWKPGVSGNPGGRIMPMHKEVQQLARSASPDAMHKLIALMDDEDSRVAYLAQTHVLERAFGKPKDYDPNEDKPPQIDFLKLSHAEREMIRVTLEAAARRQRAEAWQDAADEEATTTIEAAPGE